jgi:hypothetical protein
MLLCRNPSAGKFVVSVLLPFEIPWNGVQWGDNHKYFAGNPEKKRPSPPI